MTTWVSRECMEEILTAIKAEDKSTHIFSIMGPGGTGKTVLLHQIGEYLGNPNGMNSLIPWTGILDLFHSDVNTNSGLEGLISRSLEKEDEFQEYWIERQAFKERREAGETGKELENERASLSNIFTDCLNQVTSHTRVVIALDTTEKIVYEVDDLQKFFQLGSESTSVKEWLIDQLKKWKNCVVILAGREDAEFKMRLMDEFSQFSGLEYHPVALGGFDENEALEYFSIQEMEHPIISEFDGELKRRLWEVTDGRPIRLDLAIYTAENELGLDRVRQMLEASPSYQAQDWLDHMLINHVMQNEPDNSIRVILRYLAVARKGIDANILHYLTKGEWSIEECNKKLDMITGRSYIKQRPEDGRLYLHDEMYQLCDKHMLEASVVQELSNSLVAWCDEKINTSQDEKDKQNIQVDSLFYRLRANVNQGYHWYIMIADEAIRYAESGLDMRLRNELYAFLKSQSPIDQKFLSLNLSIQNEINCDSAAGWVKRFVSRGEYHKAIEVGEFVRKTPNGFCQGNLLSSELARADLNVYFAQALIYAGQTSEAVMILENIISKLEGESKPEEIARQGDPHQFEGWRRNLVLGRAHNNLGYAIWQGKSQYRRAIRHLRPAIPYFRASDLLEEYANTLDNIGRIYALLYEKEKAESMLDDSLALRRQLKRSYRIALGLNSRAIAHLTFDEPHRARKLAEEAFFIFDPLSTQRGIGLSSITLGEALRRLGNLWTINLYSTTDSENFFRDSQDALERSIYIFEEKVPEPSRLILAYNELGCTYRDRAVMLANDPEKSAFSRSLFREAVTYLNKSNNLAKDRYEIAYLDSCEDLASTFYQQGNYEYAETWLKRAYEQIPNIYKLEKGKGRPLIPAEELVEEYFLLLGKIELLYGYLRYDVGFARGSNQVSRKDLVNAVRHFVFSSTYFELYSARSRGRETAYKQLYERFKKCKYEDLRYLREDYIGNIAVDYGLDPNLVSNLFEDTLGLALEFEP
jgi:tetratricopeptide (TPR) repeat protein